MREPKRRKLVVRFGMASTAIAGVAVYLNEGLVRAGGVAAANEEQATVVPGLKDGERFVPTGLIIDLCTAPGAGETATSDRMSLGVTGSGGAAAHTSDARVCGYVIGRGR
jgi:hypothetical protein